MQNLELPILQNTISFYKQFYCYRKLFPKQDRYLLGAKCEQYIIEILETLYKAKFADRGQKLKLTEKASELLDLLKIFIRLIYELRVIPQNKYLILECQLYEIGKMLGGWIKSLSIN